MVLKHLRTPTITGDQVLKFVKENPVFYRYITDDLFSLCKVNRIDEFAGEDGDEAVVYFHEFILDSRSETKEKHAIESAEYLGKHELHIPAPIEEYLEATVLGYWEPEITENERPGW